MLEAKYCVMVRWLVVKEEEENDDDNEEEEDDEVELILLTSSPERKNLAAILTLADLFVVLTLFFNQSSTSNAT
jgi:hypothetical protein